VNLLPVCYDRGPSGGDALILKEEFNIGPWRVEPQRLQLSSAGTSVTIKPKSMAVLVALASAEGQVMTRAMLLDQVWGDAEVTDDVLTQSIVELRRALGDDARRPKYIETIKRVGFRLIPAAERAASTLPAASRVSRLKLPMLAVCFTALVVSGWFFTQPEPAVEPLSLAVLPFVNYGDDDGHFADGVTEELLNSLGQLQNLKVLARTSSFALRNQDLTIIEIGRVLQVSYVVDGSIRRDGGRIRVAAELVATADGYQRWARSYEQDLDDVFQVQQQIAADIAQALALNLGAVADRTTTDDARAFDLYLAGKHHARLGDIARAVALYERAVTADPTYALAHAELAKTLVFFQENRAGVRQSGNNFAAQIQRAQVAAAAAETLAPRNVDTQIALAAIAVADGNTSSERQALQRALTLDPDSVEANMRLAALLESEGHYAQAVAHLEAAAASDPLNPELAADHARLIALFDGYQPAVARLRRLIDLGLSSPRLWDALLDLAADFGRYEDRVRSAVELEHSTPDAAWPKAQLGDAFTELGAFELADAWIAAAERVSPVEALKSRARWYAATGNLEAFANLSNEALSRPDAESAQMSPAVSAASGLSAIASINNHQPHRAISLLNRLLADSPTLHRRNPHQPVYVEVLLAQAMQDIDDAAGMQQALAVAFDQLSAAERAGITHYPWLTLTSATALQLSGNPDAASRAFEEAVEQGWRAWYLEQYASAKPLTEYASTIELIEADLARMRETVQREGLALPPPASDREDLQ